MSESNQVILRYVEESTYGTTPASATWQALRYTGEQFTATPNTITSSEIRADRMTSDMPKVGMSVSGGIDIELSSLTYDDFLEAAMCDTWATDTPAIGSNQLKIGTDDKSFTVEKEFADIGKFVNFTGMRVGGMSLNMAYGSIITGSFSFAGNGATTPVSSGVGGGSTASQTTTGVLNASSDVGTVKIDGVATDICINSMSLEVNNNLREITCVGLDAPKDQMKGTASVTGSVEMYLDADSFAMYSKALLNQSISLEYSVTDGTNTYTFLIPNAKLSGDTPQSGGLDSDVMVSLNFTGLYDATEDSSLVVTYSA